MPIETARKINIKIEKNFVPLNLLHLFSLKTASVAMILLGGDLCDRRHTRDPHDANDRYLFVYDVQQYRGNE